jgi:hypothetical protein
MEKYLSEFRKTLYKHNYIESCTKHSYNIKCPFHNEIIGESLYINFSQNFFKCYGKCGEDVCGEIAVLMNNLGLLSSTDLMYNELESFDFSLTGQFKKDVEEFKENFLEFNLSRHLKWDNQDYSYLNDRGISDEICLINKICNVDFMRRIFIPFWYNKTCYGIVGRSTLTDKEIEYIDNKIMTEIGETDHKKYVKMWKNNELQEKYPTISYYRHWLRYINNSDLPKKELLFEPLSNKKPDENTIWFICEGMINALTCNAFGQNSYALLGSSPTNFQSNYIQNSLNGRLVLLFDNDKAGRNSTEKFRNLYKSPIEVFNWHEVEIMLHEKFNDINQLWKYLDFNVSYMKEIMKSCISYF